jgi:peptidoglycan/LPS O-acetylase OafA/YrhL
MYRFSTNSLWNYELHTFSCIGDMAVGGLGAWGIQSSDRFLNFCKNLSKRQIWTLYLLFWLFFFLRKDIMLTNEIIMVFERGILAIIILFIILEQNYAKESIVKMSKFKIISKLGIISYGLYCLHFVGILVVTTLTNKYGYNNSLFQVLVLETLLSLALTIAISILSYELLESPFLRLKNKFAFFLKSD